MSPQRGGGHRRAGTGHCHAARRDGRTRKATRAGKVTSKTSCQDGTLEVEKHLTQNRGHGGLTVPVRDRRQQLEEETKSRHSSERETELLSAEEDPEDDKQGARNQVGDGAGPASSERVTRDTGRGAAGVGRRLSGHSSDSRRAQGTGKPTG